MRPLLTLFALGLIATAFPSLFAPEANKNVSMFIDKLHKDKPHIDKKWLNNAFAHITINHEVLASIQRPLESLSWQKYKKRVVSAKRISSGIDFFNEYKSTLQYYQKRYGIPAHVVVAILGIETNYAANQGKFNALEALATLAFYYVPRHDFFTDELYSLLVTAWENNWDLRQIKGSYAGALGIPQFMPSNIPLYAVSRHSSKRKPNLFSEKEDAIHSVFSYLSQRGRWQAYAPIAKKLSLSPKQASWISQRMQNRDRVVITQEYQQALGLPAYNGQTWIQRLDREGMTCYYQVWPNFLSIMTYNNSALYALAVYELSTRINQQST